MNIKVSKKLFYFAQADVHQLKDLEVQPIKICCQLRILAIATVS